MQMKYACKATGLGFMKIKYFNISCFIQTLNAKILLFCTLIFREGVNQKN